MSQTIHPAYDILAELNDHYSKTKDPDTAKKIISLVESELKYEMSSSCRTFEKSEEFPIFSFFGFSFFKDASKNKDLSLHDPFIYYRELVKERNERWKRARHDELKTRFGVDATLKGNDWVKGSKAEDIERRNEEMYKSFFNSLQMMSRNMSLFIQCYDDLLLNRNMCIDNFGFTDLEYLNTAFEGMANEIKGLILSTKNEYAHMHENEYVDYFLSIDTKDARLQRALVCSRSEINHVVEEETLVILKAIANERRRQVSEEGYTAEYDDRHDDGSIANAAAHYICADDNINLWTWDKNFDKKEKHPRDKQLLIGVSMAVAEMEREARKKINTDSK